MFISSKNNSFSLSEKPRYVSVKKNEKGNDRCKLLKRVLPMGT